MGAIQNIVAAALFTVETLVFGSKKELDGDAAVVFGSGPNLNSKLDKNADKRHLRESWAMANYNMPWSEVKKRLKRREVSIYTVNLPAHDSCPGETEFCKLCYADKGRSLMQQEKYRRLMRYLKKTNFGALVDNITALPLKAWIRIHASGDFFSAAYVRAWIRALKRRPDIKAWAYTRSWNVPQMVKNGMRRRDAVRLLNALEELRALPNMQLFASTDPTMADISYVVDNGWRIAYIEGDDRLEGSGLDCPEQTGDLKRPDCKACGYCPLAVKSNVGFHIHSAGKRLLEEYHARVN